MAKRIHLRDFVTPIEIRRITGLELETTVAETLPLLEGGISTSPGELFMYVIEDLPDALMTVGIGELVYLDKPLELLTARPYLMGQSPDTRLYDLFNTEGFYTVKPDNFREY